MSTHIEGKTAIIKDWGLQNNVVINDPVFKGYKKKIRYHYKSEGVMQGLTGEIIYDNIILDAKPSFAGLTPESKQLYAERQFESVGLLLDDKYQKFNTPMKAIVVKGQWKGFTANVSLATVNQKQKRSVGEEWTISILTDDEKKRYFTEYAHSRGYKIIEYPENLAVRKKCKLLSPQGNEWETVWYYFAYQENCNCPLDVKRSIGERMVSSLLKANNISFEEQRKVVTNGRTLFFDFYLPEGNIYIEYNGKQHYEDTGGYHKGKLQELKERDQLKVVWCEQVGATLVTIPYTSETIDAIADVLDKVVPVPNREVSLSYTSEISNEEIIEYYKTHTGKETCEKYNLTIRRLGLLCKRMGFKKR